MGQCGLISSLFTFEAERYCLFCFFFCVPFPVVQAAAYGCSTFFKGSFNALDLTQNG